jgi:hypothetical protein
MDSRQVPSSLVRSTFQLINTRSRRSAVKAPGQGLGLAQAEGEGDGPAGGVADLRGGFQDGAILLEVEGSGDVARVLRRRVDERGDVAGGVAALDGDGPDFRRS